MSKFQISEEQYNYLLPVFGIIGTNQMSCIIERKIEKYFFFGTYVEHLDLLNRCKYMK